MREMDSKGELDADDIDPVVGPSYAWGFPVVLFEYAALALNRAVVPKLLSDAFGNNAYIVNGMAEGVKGLLAFLGNPVFGVYSDAFGRRIPMAIAAAGVGAPHVIYAMTQSVQCYVVVLGLSGAFSATLPLAFSYVADLVPREGRAAAFGLTLAMFGLSMAFGPLTGGLVAEAYGTRMVFWCSTALTAMAVLFVWFVLPESLPTIQGGRKRIEWSSANPCRLIDTLSTSPQMKRLTAVSFLFFFSLWSVISQLLLYSKRRFDFSPAQSGALLTVVGVAMMIAEGVLVRVLVRHFKEKHVLMGGLAAFAVFAGGLGVATQPWHLYVLGTLALFGGVTTPAIASLISRATPELQQGKAQGANNSVRALCEGTAPVLSGGLMMMFDESATPGLPFVAVGCVSAAAVYVASGLQDEDLEGMVPGPGAWVDLSEFSDAEDIEHDLDNGKDEHSSLDMA